MVLILVNILNLLKLKAIFFTKCLKQQKKKLYQQKYKRIMKTLIQLSMNIDNFLYMKIKVEKQI